MDTDKMDFVEKFLDGKFHDEIIIDRHGEEHFLSDILREFEQAKVIELKQSAVSGQVCVHPYVDLFHQDDGEIYCKRCNEKLTR